MSKIIAAISNVSMALGHEGLASVCSGLKIDPVKLKDGELILFVNKARNRLKILGAKGIVLGYLRMPNDERLPLEAIQFIPRTFSHNGQVNLNAAIEAYMIEKLKKRARAGEEMDSVRSGR